MFFSKLVISTRHVYILDKKRNVTYTFNARLLLTEVIICIRVFYFMSKCKNVFRDLKMNITTKAGKLKSTDQFDFRKPFIKLIYCIYLNMGVIHGKTLQAQILNAC